MFESWRNSELGDFVESHWEDFLGLYLNPLCFIGGLIIGGKTGTIIMVATTVLFVCNLTEILKARYRPQPKPTLA